MLKNSLPQTPAELLRWNWDNFAPLYQELDERRITFENAEIWLADWSRVQEAAQELASRLNYAVTANTADGKARQRLEDYYDNFYPHYLEAETGLKRKLIDSGVELPGMEIPTRNMRAEADLFREANLPLLSEEQKLTTEYDRIVGAQTVDWEGQEVTISQLRPIYEDQDRERRERAWRLGAERQLADREAISQLWQKLFDLRGRIAANAGKKNYLEYRWQEYLRFDYTPEDTQSFDRAIEEVVVPVAERLYERRRARLGVETLRPWDLDVDPLARPPLHPYDSIDELKEKASVTFNAVHPELGEYFDTMVEEKLLDLANRKNKGPGAYCTAFPMTQRPFIFANAVGLHDDVQTVLHESGHAFHVFEASKLPFNMERETTMEFAEVASMGMELLAGRYLDTQPGGFYSQPADADRARAQHLEGSILFWPYMAVVDSFQTWAYLHPEQAADPAALDDQWAQLWNRYMVGQDWTGLEDAMATGWQRKQHILTVPFYYIEYGLAQLGAAQIWARSLKDPAGAVNAYRRALSLGGTVPLPALFEAAGARLAFDPETLAEAVSTMETMILSLDQHQPPVAG